ncbi:MAG: aminotransferase class V-fold PLP-dependent enzyme [Clostridia bacterium]|nr:aminotransferase class V-fold PLP-dependent enzyme [Clostridia bacterium]
MKRTIYFDNAATTFPKPECVHRAVIKYAENYAGNPGRGSHKMSLLSSGAVFDVREKLADEFSASPERVAFTANVTESLNMAIKGVFGFGDNLLISNMEHNAVLRPVSAICGEKNGTYDIFDIVHDEEETIKSLKSKLTRKTRAVITTHMSNLCAVTAPIERIGRFCRENGLYFIVDAAQSAGRLPIDMRVSNIDMLCITGHKSLYGYMGAGALIFGENVEPAEIRTIIEGGSGVDSVPLTMPEIAPERFEAGTIPAHAIISMGRGLDWVQSVGRDKIFAHEKRISEVIISQLSEICGVTLYGAEAGATILFNISGVVPSDVSTRLSEKDICVRSGLHCAPLAHRTLGTFPTGAVRIGIGAFNTEAEANILCGEIRAIARMQVP